MASDHLRVIFVFLEPKFGDFLSTIDDTRIAINKWLKKIGIKDLNVEWNR